jgi:hypothetical protein
MVVEKRRVRRGERIEIESMGRKKRNSHDMVFCGQLAELFYEMGAMEG